MKQYTWKVTQWEDVETGKKSWTIVSTKPPKFIPEDKGGPYWEYEVICENVKSREIADEIVKAANTREVNPLTDADLSFWGDSGSFEEQEEG